MDSSLKPKQADDPHDFVVVPPDAVRVAPSDDEISDLLRAAARQRSDGQVRNVDPMAELSVLPADATFRPTADAAPLRGRSTGRRLMRALAAVLIAACVGAAAMAWQASGYAAKKLVAKWIPQFALTSSLSLDKLGLGAESASPANESEVADAPPAQSASPEQAGPEGAAAIPAAPPADSSQSLASMARDLASVSQEVEALKAGIAELKASQQQMARDLAKASEKASEPIARAKLTAAAPHPPAARKPQPVYSPAPTASAPAYRPTASPYAATPTVGASGAPQAAQPYPQPYAPRQVEPLPPPAPPQLPPEPGFGSVPRPPMPVQ
ncbi:MAG TPA: hypothetical protein VKS24_02935 [Bradyrhizobium sp.]|nr:hypothetical protein [Bradyrhizobium sp.]